jgi:ABC-type lipoprotein export system ATPase subunit
LYYEIKNISVFNSITVSNTLLTDLWEDQTNLVFIVSHDKELAEMFNNKNTNKTFLIKE